FISFVIIPFIGFSKIRYDKIDFIKLYRVFIITALAFSILSITLYGKFIGQVARLNENSTGEEVISPLILSYCGALIIGVVSFFLLYSKKINRLLKITSIACLCLALIPFFLGASRGSIFAVFIPFILMAFSN